MPDSKMDNARLTPSTWQVFTSIWEREETLKMCTDFYTPKLFGGKTCLSSNITKKFAILHKETVAGSTLGTLGLCGHYHLH